MSAIETEYLNHTQAAEYLGVSRDTLRRWRDKGSIPFIVVKMGEGLKRPCRIIRYSRRDIDEMMANHRNRG